MYKINETHWNFSSKTGRVVKQS